MSKKTWTGRVEITKLKKDLFGEVVDNHCVDCKQEFTNKNVFSEAGWRETQITGLCEKCFDRLTIYDEDEYD